MEAGTAAVPWAADPAGLFGRAAPLVLDLGCGNGVFLEALALREPENNVLGIEKKDYRVRQSRRRAASLPNARVLLGEVMEVLRELPPRSVRAAHLLFSDPWPKRRHAVRRVLQPALVDLLAARLEGGGSFFFATDDAGYARSARGLFGGHVRWQVADWERPPDWPATEFERRFVAAGRPVWRFRARLLPHESA
jgi:tRNA (guanine-N7-)-methyltransferase